ncbi:MAG: TonB C-terminal domain-containing protein [Acidobacteria bacterium]|nr:TonB C-terminal domain-containing protein [Acidobacteriota bacterium]MBI3664030.1 TonB C-terminal domain-containing protein [Acidobacteriota bacterium]
MIPRTLVPTQLLPQAEDSPGNAKRVSTSLDSRSVVPADLPIVPLDGRSSIPSHIPLEVLGGRIVVPRDMPATPLETRSAIPSHVPLTVLDSRVAIPKDARPAELSMGARVPLRALRDMVEPDVLLTGEVNLMSQPVEEREVDNRWLSQTGTLLFHVLLVTFAVFWPSLFPPRMPTQSELELASRSLGMVYLPPSVRDVAPYVPRAAPPSPQMRIDPRILRQIAPPNVEPSPLPGPPESKPQRELPAAPAPQVPAAPERQLRAETPREPLRLESPGAPKSSSPLLLPRLSPGKALEESMRDSQRSSGSNQGGFMDVIPRRPGEGGGGGPGGGGSGENYVGAGVQMLTPTEGVDFSNYLDRVLASVRRNWYAVIPESARMGEKGRVVLQFRILRDGNVPYPEPNLLLTSTKEPLDRAAMSSIRASSPFEPLPPAFSGPFIELRFIFLYNLPLEAAR